MGPVKLLLALGMGLFAVQGRAADGNASLALGKGSNMVAALYDWDANTHPAPPAPWQVAALPGAKKPITRFDMTNLGGERAVRIRAEKSYGNLVFPLPEGGAQASTLSFTWRLDLPVLTANLYSKSADDTPLKVCALFDMPLDKLSIVERAKMRFARAVSHQHLPAATLCYVWDHSLPAGTRLANAYTNRLQVVVVDSGEAMLGKWVSHEVNLAADFKRAFGHEHDGVPPLLAIVVGADTDNTQTSSLAYVSKLSWQP